MSKLSFRARALDPSKPMPIFMAEELPDLPDFSAINRAVPQMPTGMQKEEECEHHLQRAICAGLIIPTPEVTDVPLKDFYDKVYPANYKQPRQLIHMQPFTMEQEIPDYDMDSDDELWLQLQKPRLDITPLKFEEMMDRLEKSSGQTVVTLSEAKALLKEDDELTITVYDYWLNKRLNTQHPLILSVRTEHRSGTAANNPYLAFRRRTEKMQTRKNRKNDEVSYEKMLKLRRDLIRAVTLLELVKRREKCKREFVHLTFEVFEKRFQAKDFSGAVAAEAKIGRPAFQPIFHNHNQSWAEAVTAQNKTLKEESIARREKRQYKKRRKLGRVGVEGVSSDEETTPLRVEEVEPETEQEDEGPYAFRRNVHCSYQKPLATTGSWPWEKDNRFRFTLTSLSNRKCVGFARRRVGRGGRIILDRVSTDQDDFWRSMDFSIIEPDPLQARIKTEQINEPSDTYYNKYSAISTSIKEEPKVDRLHFRPKTPPPDYIPPCHLLPIEPLLSDDTPTFQIDIEPLFPNSVVPSENYLTNLFELDRRWEEPVGPQGPIFEGEDEEDETWRTVGVSKFTLTDVGGACGVGVREAVKFEGVDSDEEKEERDNGLIAFAADVPTGKVRKPFTLNNSHSANNLMEFPLTAAVDVAVDSAQAPTQTGGVTPAKATPNGGVRNSKSTLAMEVT